MSGLTVTMPIEHWEELKKTHLPKEESARRRKAIMAALEDFSVNSGYRHYATQHPQQVAQDPYLSRFLKVLEENLP